MTMETQTLESGPVVGLNLPTRESSRKRIKKSMGPDFIEDYTKSFKAAPPKTPVQVRVPPPLPTPPIPRTAKKLNSILERTLRRTQEDAVPPKLVVSRASLAALPRPDACRVCIGKGEMELAFTAQDAMLRCGAYSCHYAVHKSCSPYTTDQVPFVCLPCRQCVFCKKKRIPGRLDITCAKCNDLYHENCYAKHGVCAQANKPKHDGKDWLCGSCLGYETKPIKKRKKWLPISPNPPLPIVTLNGVPATVAGNGSVLIEIPRNTDRGRLDGDGTKHPLVLDTGEKIRKAPRSPRIKLQEKRKAKALLAKNQSAKAAEDTLPDAISQKLAAVKIGPSRASEPLILSRKEEKKIRTRQEEDSELRQDMAVWSVDQGAAYFRDSCPELSQLIVEHDLIGSALVIISRTQFLDLFQLPVGKALNMHAAVCRCRRMFF